MRRRLADDARLVNLPPAVSLDADESRRLISLYREAGDLEARNQLVLAKAGLVLHAIRGRTRDWQYADVCDLIAYLLQRLIRAVDAYRLDSSASFDTYALKTLKWAICDYRRGMLNYPVYFSDWARNAVSKPLESPIPLAVEFDVRSHDRPNGEESPPEACERRERFALLGRMLAEIEPEDARAVLMRAGGVSLDRIGEEVYGYRGPCYKSVMRRIGKAMARLRAMAERPEGERC